MNEIEKLKATIHWLLENQAYYSKGGTRNDGSTYPPSWSDGGCGCCAVEIVPPDEIAETLKEFV